MSKELMEEVEAELARLRGKGWTKEHFAQALVRILEEPEPYCFTENGKIQFVVIDENVLGVIHPQPTRPLPLKTVEVLAASILRGASCHPYGNIAYPLPPGRVRAATRADFGTFRIHTAGYEADPRYDFPTQ